MDPIDVLIEQAAQFRLIDAAFDAGEYDHRDGRDPVAALTRPLIRNILERST